MHIILGHELDTASYPDALNNSEAAAGKVVVGPAGMISILETRLGLTRIWPNPGVRMGTYLKLIGQLDDGGRFYSESMNADAWSTAKTVLAWRDQLKIAGWDFNPSGKGQSRLETLSELEKLFRNQLVEGHVDRLELIHDALAQTDEIDISDIVLVEPLQTWDVLWRKIFELLKSKGVCTTENSKQASSKPNNLGCLKRAMEQGKPLDASLASDDSLCMISAKTEWEAAEAVASFLEINSDNNHNILIIRGAGSRILDDTLNRHGLPRLGHDSTSRWRTALQVLPLVLANHWDPFNAQRLLEFLSLPEAPVRQDIRSWFANALREHPGIYGPKWEVAVNKAINLSDSKDPDELRAELDFWFGTTQRHPPNAGLPVSLISEICDRLSKWAGQEGGKRDDVLMLKASSVFNDFRQAVQITGMSQISEAQLNRILDSVIGEGLEGLDSFAQAASWSVVNTPGQIWGEADTIIWWNFSSNGTTPLNVPWSDDELGDLARLGAGVRSTSKNRLLEAQSWRNAIKWATNRLILVKPSSIAGEPVNPHPFWDEISYLLNPGTENTDAHTFDASLLWKANSVGFMGNNLTREAVQSIDTPQARGQWQIQPGRIEGRSKESASGMENLLYCPLSWVMQYILKISPQVMISLPSGSQMLGTLAHAIFEQVLTRPSLPSPDDAAILAKQAFDELAPQMAASLLLPQQKPESERSKTRIAEAAKELCRLIRSWNLVVKGMEQEMKRNDFIQNKEFSGRIDLVLENDRQEEIFIDLKWSKKSDDKRTELAAGKAIQLAAYAWLLESGRSRFPFGAYYMLAQSEILAPKGGFFDPQYEESERELEDIWQESFDAYQKNLQDLKDGTVNIPMVAQILQSKPDMDQSTDSQEINDHPTIETKCKYCNFRNLCGIGGVQE